MDIMQLAEWFLAKDSMTNKKLQKMCYYAVAWGYALMDKPIASNDRFEAWVHGPVSPVLYDKYKTYGWNSIPKQGEAPSVEGDVKELLEAVWFTYGDKDGNELEVLSHTEMPWIEARQGLGEFEKSETPINSRTMANFYNSIKTTE